MTKAPRGTGASPCAASSPAPAGRAPGRGSNTAGLPAQATGAPATQGADPTAGLLEPFALPSPLRERFEDSLGVDLGGVRLHADDASAEHADALGAHAFATGSDIHFGAGQYRPDDPFGQHLIAHEVAHTVQQSSGAAGGVQLQAKSGGGADALEQKADGAADAMVDGVTEDDTKFATAFAAEFKGVLNVFPDPSAKALCAKKDPVFSPWQRTMLSKFISTKHIPDGLFTGAHATGKATIPQKTLLAGHILAHGTNGKDQASDSKEAPGKVKAENCGRWAELVWIYAGVQSSKGDPSAYEGTMMGATGPTGEVSFGGGGPNQVIGAHGSKANDAANAGAGACLNPPGKVDILGQGDPKKMFDYLMKIEPGDWIWIDNGKYLHSEIFVDWKVKPKEGAESRGIARVFSQRANEGTEKERVAKHGGAVAGAWAKDGGGDLHDQPLGYPLSVSSPVTHTLAMIQRPAADAGPPRDEQALLHYDQAAAVAKNQKQIADNKIDLAKYHAAMGNAASARLGDSDSYEPALRTLCASIRSDANAPATLQNLSRMIALVQRMSSTNASQYKNGIAGRAINGWLDLAKAWDSGLVPGGVAAIKKAAP